MTLARCIECEYRNASTGWCRDITDSITIFIQGDCCGTTNGRWCTCSVQVIYTVTDERLCDHFCLSQVVINNFGGRASGIVDCWTAANTQDHRKCCWLCERIYRSVLDIPSLTACYSCSSGYNFRGSSSIDTKILPEVGLKSLSIASFISYCEFFITTTTCPVTHNIVVTTPSLTYISV